MTSFVHVEQPTQHPGVARAERAAGSITQAVRKLTSVRGVATVVLVSGFAALAAAASQAGSLSENHLLAGWVALWAIAFAVVALLAGPIGKGLQRLRSVLRTWAVARRAAEQDEKLWQLALTDARIMADISRAMSSDARDVRHYD
jgi:hypothetical protein